MYFEFIFIEGVRLRLRLICWRVNVQLFQHHVERTVLPFSTESPFHFCQSWVQYAEGGLFLNSLLRSTGLHGRPFTSTHLLAYCSFTVCLDIGYEVLQLLFGFRIILAPLVSLPFQYKIYSQCVNIYKHSCWDWNWGCVESRSN